mgnify:CR=1 FL=1
MTSKRRKQRGKPPTEDIEEETANSTTDQSNKKSKRNDALAFVDEVKASMQNKGQCTFNESSEVLQIEPLPQIHGKRSKRIFLSPSLPSLALMVISDPFVARIVLFKCFQELKRIINDKQIPLENIKLTSLLQICKRYSSQ